MTEDTEGAKRDAYWGPIWKALQPNRGSVRGGWNSARTTRFWKAAESMITPPRAALHVAPVAPENANGDTDIAHEPDPLKRLEAELQRANKFPDSERLHEQAWGLLEEAWNLVTECLVLRDGLLDACHEIEQTMEGIQRRLEALPPDQSHAVKRSSAAASAMSSTAAASAVSSTAAASAMSSVASASVVNGSGGSAASQ